MRISDHFTLRELTKSQTAARLGINNDIASNEHLASIVALCHNILEPIRREFGVVSPSSGYRSPALNKAIGSNPDGKSQHCIGEAVDFECPRSTSNFAVAEWILKNLNFDQLILEYFTPDDPFSGWIHVSGKRSLSENRGTCLRASKDQGKTYYNTGLK